MKDIFPLGTKTHFVATLAVVIGLIALGTLLSLSTGGTKPSKADRKQICPGNSCHPTTSTTTTTTTTPTTTTVPTSTTSRALGVIRYGSATFGINSNLYNVCVVGQSQLQTAIGLPCKALLYVAAGETGTQGFQFWMPWATANNNGWWLHDSSGNVMIDPSFNDYLYDIGRSDLQQEWIKNVLAYLSAHPGVNGVMIDNVLRDITSQSKAGYPREHPTQSLWDAAMVSFVAAVGPALRSHGYYVMANDNGYYSEGGVTCNSAQCTKDWWPQLDPYIDSNLFEGWMTTSDGRVRTAGTDDWHKFWYQYASTVELSQQLNTDILVEDTVAFGDTNHMTYARASFLLFWDGSSNEWSTEAIGGNGYNSGDPWDNAWTVDAGAPIAPRVALTNGMYTRAYSKANVYVNPTAATQTADGITFAAATAKIVVK